MFKKIISFIIAISIVTVVFGTIYATVQQNYRQSANDPQVQMAEDTANFLSNGGQIQQLATIYPQVNFAKSLAPFLIMYDEQGKVVLSTGNMDNVVPTPPTGVFIFTKLNGENRLTWQPRNDVRIASVIVPYLYQNSSGFILAGRNLREVEFRENHLTLMVFAGWILSVIGLIFYFAVKIF